MRILLAQNSLYYPAHGGGDRSNRLLLEALAQQGHICEVVARAHTELSVEQHRRYLRELELRSIAEVSEGEGVVRFPLNGVHVHAVTSHPNLRDYFTQRIASFEPDVILASTDDPAQLMLPAALGDNPARVVFLTRTTLSLPFGPECAFPSEQRTELLRKVDGVIGVSQYVASYIEKWSGIKAVALPISLLEEGPYPALGDINNEFVTLVNPCAVKGISIFLALAGLMPDTAFAAIPTWGTTREDLDALEKHTNISILEPVDNIDEILKRTRVLLVPSLWAEARSRIIVEALLRGIPVLASDVGGIPEAMMGVDYLLPVKRIERYHPKVNEQMVPVASVPDQDIGPWHKTLHEVVSDHKLYERLSSESRQAALAYAGALSITPFENFLKKVMESPRNSLRTALKTRKSMPAASLTGGLSDDKRALLALRLKKKSGVASSRNAWFPAMGKMSGAGARLFCFPYAGGGASVFRGWANKMPSSIAICPVRLPGRENRTTEAPFDRIEPLVEALSKALQPYVEEPFAFFGHSMGAAIAFELARNLRRRNQPAPLGLFVSGARAPQFRLNHSPPPEPSEQEFIEELRRLEGVPKELLNNKELLGFLLPAIRADSQLCRILTYTPEPPLDCPIHAYVGADDPRLPSEVVEAWREQTTGLFKMQHFPGGHFFLHTSENEFLGALGHDLAQIINTLK